ncbi:SCF ubiquitin ligase complex subunit GRR1 NDAI_0D00560 [Naumovozyma dairenensis CBS 421]|uniref:F-box domain-containing protein n=1 Tax=Naumovozyma dairenensis (strain ATCC 10597 / BCRC 20456 / CBS 421 / NBRC 0211 / NRRL Y-12639) TaxID=1071378 RepID=G0W9A9_NAUDC|nr:hypothetical protein NDAI_0D00560 [Naumovozyma dairenensis CBS 421]CCD24370.1 hypothetical protein NDAI_0D00560 [Naumovozyma dairenensis CBS 421]
MSNNNSNGNQSVNNDVDMDIDDLSNNEQPSINQNSRQQNLWYPTNRQASTVSQLPSLFRQTSIRLGDNNNNNNNMLRMSDANVTTTTNMNPIPHSADLLLEASALLADNPNRTRSANMKMNNTHSNNNNNNNNDLLLTMATDLANLQTNIELLSEEDAQQVLEFQTLLREKTILFLNNIEKRRQETLENLHIDNLKLQHSQSPQASIILNKLQRMRVRAVETETRELQKLRLKILTIVDEYEKSLEYYYTHRGLDTNYMTIINPTYLFKEWVQSLDPDTNPELTDGLNQLNEKSRRLLIDILHTTKNPDLFANPPRDQALIRYSNNMYVPFPLHKMPSEILHLVLDKLANRNELVYLLTVNKLWAEIIVKIIYYRPHLNKKHQLELFMRTMSRTNTETIFDYRSLIKRLNFSFVGDFLTDEELMYFIGCSNLERLTLVFCKHITSAPVAAVLNNCKYLQSVDITGVKEISDDVFDSLARSCPRLQGFYVPQAKTVTLNSLTNFIHHVPMLKRVKITANVNMNDELVELMADKCPLLVEVDITSSPNIHDSSLLKLFTKLTQLREFRITHNLNITDQFVLELYKKVKLLPSLRLIDFSSCDLITDRMIETLVLMAPKLRNVFVGKCSKISDRSLRSLAKLGKNLQTVHFGHCFNITDQGVRTLVQSCPRIQYVDFACCTNLTNRTLYELSDLTRLKRIGLVKCSQMTDEGLLNMISLRGRNDTLERVHLSYCSNLTIYPIYELLMACPRLSHLSLTAVPSFLRPDITAFCRTAPADFSDNQRQIFCVFSGRGVHRLRHYLMSLTTPTDSPQTSIHDVLTRYIIAKNMLKPGESIKDAIKRITKDLTKESAAILTATSINQISGINTDYSHIEFGAIPNLISWTRESVEYDEATITGTDELIDEVDTSFCDDPFQERFNNGEVIVAPGATRELNRQLCHAIKKFHELFDRVEDFEVNVASLARVQFQFTGFLLQEMSNIYLQLDDWNNLLARMQMETYRSGIEENIRGFYTWKLSFVEKPEKALEKFEISTVVLRLYLKDSLALLARQRELILAQQRNGWNANGNGNQGENGAPDAVQNINDRAPLSPEQMRILQFGLPAEVIMDEDRLRTQVGESRSETPEEEVTD